jgi:hypothetical protein
MAPIGFPCRVRGTASIARKPVSCCQELLVNSESLSLQIESRPADDFKDVGGGGLLLPRLF